jgi:predicted component of type VI protein secretion system
MLRYVPWLHITGPAEIFGEGVSVLRISDAELWVSIPKSGMIVGRGKTRGPDIGKPKLRVLVDTISKRQLAIRENDGRWELRDLQSASGTSVNGQVLKSTVHVLGHGDVVALGSPDITARYSGHPPRGLAAPYLERQSTHSDATS